MMLRIVVLLLLGFSFWACNTTSSQNEKDQIESAEKRKPNYNVAVNFINDYVNYSNDVQRQIGIIEWVNNRNDVTNDFKRELKNILDESKKEDPELGLGFDPILDAQDGPKEFQIDKTDSEYLIVRGIEWVDFRLTLKLKHTEHTWLVDGSGIINVPQNKKIKR